MPRKYVKKTSKRKTYKRGKRTTRKFTRKTAIIRNPLSQPSLMVPLQYPFSFDYTTTQVGDGQFIFSGSSYPNCIGLIPPNIGLGSRIYELPVGLAQYGGMYTKFRVHGSSIDVTVTNMSTRKVRAGLLAVPYDCSTGQQQSSGPGGGSWSGNFAGVAPVPLNADFTGDIKNYLESSYVDLMNDPYIKWRTIHESANPRCQTRFKSSRKTKTMIGAKDLKDTDYCTNDIISSDRDPIEGAASEVASRGFCWMIKVDDETGVVLKVQGKITYYIELFERMIVRNPD